MTEKRVSSDVIVYAFSFLKPGTRFSMDKMRIIRIFYDISQEKEFKEMLKDFSFDTSRAPTIWCKTVNNAFDRLTMSSLLSRIDLEKFEITKELTKKDASKLFDKKEIELLKSIALQFARKIGAYKPY